MALTLMRGGPSVAGDALVDVSLRVLSLSGELDAHCPLLALLRRHCPRVTYKASSLIDSRKCL